MPIPNHTNQLARPAVSFIGLVQVVALLVVTGTLMALLRQPYWLLELATHFHLVYLLLVIILLPVLWWLKQRGWVIAMLLAGVANLMMVLPIYSSIDQIDLIDQAGNDELAMAADKAEQQLVLWMNNVSSGNQRYQRIQQSIDQADADMLLLLEVSHQMATALAGLKSDYPHQLVHARSDNFGIAILSRLPLQQVRVLRLGSAGLPSMLATLELNGRDLQLLVTHTRPPLMPSFKQMRDDQLQAIGDYLASTQLPTLLVGDLNTSHWSPVFQHLLADTGLVNARQGIGLLGTWPALGNLGLLPIDHLLVPADVQILQLETGLNTGSDHLPLVARISWAPKIPGANDSR